MSNSEIIHSAPASEIISALPTSQALEDDFEIPKDWRAPEWVSKDLCPLFADSLPDDFEQRPDFTALQSLLYDQDPEVAAENLKEQGNLALKKGKIHWDEAINFFTQAIAANSPIKKNVSIYYSNRAYIQLLKGNFGKTVSDCEQSLLNDSTNIKSWYRLAKANLSLGKLEEAIKGAENGLRISPGNTELQKMSDEIKLKITEANKKDLDKKREQQRKIQFKLLFQEALEAKGVIMGAHSLHSIQDECKEKIWFHPITSINSNLTTDNHPQPRENTLEELVEVKRAPSQYEMRMPFLICYPEYSQTDLIQNVSENDMIGAHLANLLPVGKQRDGLQLIRDFDDSDMGDINVDYALWDKRHSYALRSVRLFFRKDWVDHLKTKEMKTGEKQKQNGDAHISSVKQNEWFEVPFEFTVGQMIGVDIPNFIYIVGANSVVEEAQIIDPSGLGRNCWAELGRFYPDSIFGLVFIGPDLSPQCEENANAFFISNQVFATFVRQNFDEWCRVERAIRIGAVRELGKDDKETIESEKDKQPDIKEVTKEQNDDQTKNNETEIVHPLLIAMFNPGLGFVSTPVNKDKEIESSNITDTWEFTMAEILLLCSPTLITVVNDEDDLQSTMKYLQNKNMQIIIDPPFKLNPFASQCSASFEQQEQISNEENPQSNSGWATRNFAFTIVQGLKILNKSNND
ncbi:MAG: putative tetratricopeptide repeat protein 4 [Streblomastix strix]|uniref:Putative tetratricopeptide repeat protein 4 n=1 Tax=Streblomastix strix TaxID=222440 RepID=A0A5J4VNU0_9EUKA|nr:MAG: putative tetratricopeptide repeat protein 4 [Streblomastix strix]